MGAFRKFWYRLRHWEHWPAYLVYFPVFFLYLFYAIKARSFFFFTASNPSIPTGGAYGESKSAILKLLPAGLVPPFILVQPSQSLDEQRQGTGFENLRLPIIAKPDIGERGNGVELIRSQEQLLNYHKKSSEPYLLQEYVDLPLELGVFYVRLPSEPKGRVTSVTGKEFLSITGDGRQSISQLAQRQARAQLVWPQIQARMGSECLRVPDAGELVVLEPIGNHCRGTAFLDLNEQTGPFLHRFVDELSKSIPGFYFGRFDLRCSGWEAFEGKGKIQIVELNGCSAEPAHIYQSGFSFVEAQKVLFHHMSLLYQVSKINHDQGVEYLSSREMLSNWRRYRQSLPKA